MFTATQKWLEIYPGAQAGFLVMRNIANLANHPALDRHKEDLEAWIRSHYSGMDRAALLSIDAIQVYNNYYRRFKKTYHVLLQLESILFQDKHIPTTNALVQVMFMAELKNMLLTAVHDLDAIQLSVDISVAGGEESYVTLNGTEQKTKPGDMIMSDRQGVISSIVYGPDFRTRIQPGTRQVLFAVYAPHGIVRRELQQHLQDISELILLFAPDAMTESITILGG